MNTLMLSALLSVRSSKVLCLLLLIVLLSGCRGVIPKDVHGPLPPPPSESLRSELGTVWVASSLAQPGIKFMLTPASGLWDGTKRGAGRGAGIGCSILAWPAALVGGTLAILTAPVGCAVGVMVGTIPGAIYGAIAALPANTVEAVVTTVRNTLMSSEIQQRVQDQVHELMTTRIHVPQATGNKNASTTRLETEVLSIQLDGWPPLAYAAYTVGVINPSVRLVVTAQARLIRTYDEEGLYVAGFEYWGPRMTVPEWASNEAQPLRDAFDRAALALAEQIVDAVFLLHRVP